MTEILHDSDCSNHNMPAFANGPCDCSATAGHTPAPWKIAKHSAGGPHEIDLELGGSSAWFMRLSPGYAYDQFPDSEQVRKEHEANVALIVDAVNDRDAAREREAALKTALDDIANGRMGVTDAMLVSKEAMQTAIAEYSQRRAREALASLN